MRPKPPSLAHVRSRDSLNTSERRLDRFITMCNLLVNTFLHFFMGWAVSNKSNKQASVIFHKSFYKKIEAAAKKEGISVAAWIRRLVIKEINKENV